MTHAYKILVGKHYCHVLLEEPEWVYQRPTVWR